MATMKFKTNAKCGGCVAAIGAKLNKLVKEDEWSVDLKSPDKVLEVTADVPADKIIAAVTTIEVSKYLANSAKLLTLVIAPLSNSFEK